MNTIPIKLKDTYKEADKKYGWDSRVEGLCVDFNMVNIAEMANKNLEFIIKRRKTRFLIGPSRAKEVANHYGSFYTRRHDKKLVMVIPINECERIK